MGFAKSLRLSSMCCQMELCVCQRQVMLHVIHLFSIYTIYKYVLYINYILLHILNNNIYIYIYECAEATEEKECNSHKMQLRDLLLLHLGHSHLSLLCVPSSSFSSPSSHPSFSSSLSVPSSLSPLFVTHHTGCWVK